MANIQLAKNLRALRDANNLNQGDLSDMLNISRQAYSNYENSKRTPDLDSLLRLASFYHVTLEQLVNGNLSNPVQSFSEEKCHITWHLTSKPEIRSISKKKRRS